MIIQTRLSDTSKILYHSGSTGHHSGSASKETLVRSPKRMPSRHYGPSAGQGRRISSNTSGGQESSVRQNGKKKQKKNSRPMLWAPWKLILLSVLLGIAGTVYLTHVFETQSTLREVQQLRREYERAHRVHTEVTRNYHRMTGPAAVYDRAGSIGMISGGAADPVIIIER